MVAMVLMVHMLLVIQNTLAMVLVAVAALDSGETLMAAVVLAEIMVAVKVVQIIVILVPQVLQTLEAVAVVAILQVAVVQLVALVSSSSVIKEVKEEHHYGKKYG
jgi:hypothetical protein